ncbi:protein hairy-like [Haliotis rubra]|uniref:protein hairy-like n=1 Tax=Haliotis rubra TaxID=36100 RepID=UPI001EE51E96|nr:protein hairy-like [Haliotis rubra]
MTGVKSERRRQKPLMERKRRARINRSLEQLKDVIVDNNGGILPRLDKARILELTVDYLQAKTRNGQISAGDERFKAGYLRCVNEVTSFLHDKVEDTRLTQIIQHLFTLTANIKSKVKATKTPASSDATSSTTGSGSMLVTEASTTKSTHASPSLASEERTSSRLPNLTVSREVVRASRGACSRESGEEKRPAPRTRRYGSVCSAHSAQSSTDSDISADDEDVIMTDRQGSDAHLRKKLDVGRDISYVMSDSDDDISVESEVFTMDSEDEASSGNDAPGNNGDVATNSKDAQQGVLVCGDAGDRAEASRSPVWRPW